MRPVCFTPFARCAVLTGLLLGGPLPWAQAISYTGDVTDMSGNPGDPSTWTSSTDGIVGNTGIGVVTVDPSAGLLSYDTYLGYTSTGNGTVKVNGNGTAASATWTSSDYIYCGDNGGSGTLAIGNGGAVSTQGVWFGQAGGMGTFTLDGAGSTLTTNSATYVGDDSSNAGSGTAAITNGGVVNSHGTWFVAPKSGGAGYTQIDGTKSALNLFGTYSINVGAGGNGTLLVSNGGVVNNSSGFNLAYNGGAQLSYGTVTVTGAGSAISVAGSPQLSSGGVATLNITNGGQFTSLGGAITLTGSGVSGDCIVNVDGPNSLLSTLNSSGSGNACYIAQEGPAVVNITGGGVVKLGGNATYVGFQNSGAQGTVNIDGPGSQWLCCNSARTTGALFLSNNGATATLDISGGGLVQVGTNVTVNSFALLSIDVGHGSLLSGTGTLTNSAAATVRFVAAADVAAGTYTPIAMSGFSGNGSYQGLGGTWDTSTHQFTVDSAVSAAAGTPINLTPSANQRAVIYDNSAGTSLGVGFLSTESALSVTGTTLAGTQLSSLESLLGSGNSVLDGWALSTTGGYTSGDPAYLSLSVGARYSTYTRTKLSVWQYDGSSWSNLTANDLANLLPDDLTCDGAYASFTATALSGYDYAVVGTTILNGDANRDGRVDVNDLTIVLANFGRTTGMSWSTGDLNGDGQVDVNDLTIVLANYGQSLGSSVPTPVAVPEPTCLALLGVGAVSLLAFAWRRRAWV